MIKVLVVVDSLKLGSGIMGVIMNYYRHIDKNLVQFDFLYFLDSDKTHATEIKKLGGEMFKLSMLRIGNLLSFRSSLTAFLNRHKDEYQIIHLHEVLLNFPVFSVAKEIGIPIRIIHSHNSVASDSFFKSIRNKLLCLPIKHTATDFFSCSDKAGVFLYGKNFYENGKVQIINNAVSLGDYCFNSITRDELRRKYNIVSETVLGHVGRFCIQKNHIFLIEIFKFYLKLDSNAKLVLIGDGELQSSIKNEIDNAGLASKVLFVGSVRNVSDYLNMMDALVMPSLFEGLPVVGVEAQANALPCFFSDTITKNVCILRNSQRISLSKSAKIWADIIFKNLHIDKGIRSCSVYDEFTEKGFNIKKEALKLQEIYIQKYNSVKQLEYKNK